MRQLKASVPDELVEWLERTSAKRGHSLSAEIAGRIAQSFAQEATGPPTSDFVQDVARLAVEIERECGAAWHQNAVAHETLTLAIQLWLEPLKQGPTALTSRPYATTFEDDPRKLAALIVHRLRKEPGFTNSKTRQWMEEEHRTLMGSPRALLDTPQQQRKPDQPKKRGK